MTFDPGGPDRSDFFHLRRRGRHCAKALPTPAQATPAARRAIANSSSRDVREGSVRGYRCIGRFLGSRRDQTGLGAPFFGRWHNVGAPVLCRGCGLIQGSVV